MLDKSRPYIWSEMAHAILTNKQTPAVTGSRRAQRPEAALAGCLDPRDIVEPDQAIVPECMSVERVSSGRAQFQA